MLRELRTPLGLSHQEGREISTGIPELDALLPEGGMPRGAVVELAVSPTLGQSTSLALRVCAMAQGQACLRAGSPTWCAWLDPAKSLYAPGVAAHGVVLERLLVVRPPIDALARVAVRMVSSRIFSVLVVDTVGVPGALLEVPLHRWPNVVRRLAIAAQGGDTCVVLLTDRAKSRAVGLPVAMRLELEQRSPTQLRLHVAKERRGRVGVPRELAYTRAQPSEPLVRTA